MVRDPARAAIERSLREALDLLVLNGQTELEELQLRLDSITPFQPLRILASNEMASATVWLAQATNNTDAISGATAVKVANQKLSRADRLIKKAAARPGKAPNTVVGTLLTLRQQDTTTAVLFLDERECFIQSTPTSGSSADYSFTRTGFNTGLVRFQGLESDTLLEVQFDSKDKGSFEMYEEGSTARQHGIFFLEY